MFLTQNCGQDFDGIVSESEEQNMIYESTTRTQLLRTHEIAHTELPTSNFKEVPFVWTNAAAYSVATNGFSRGELES
jgi:hypothetical protein